VYTCTRLQPVPETDLKQPTRGMPLVVKVCDTSDVGLDISAQNEAKLLQEINCTLVNRIIAFHEDPLINKSYLVLEKAGEKTLNQFLREIKGTSGINQS